MSVTCTGVPRNLYWKYRAVLRVSGAIAAFRFATIESLDEPLEIAVNQLAIFDADAWRTDQLLEPSNQAGIGILGVPCGWEGRLIFVHGCSVAMARCGSGYFSQARDARGAAFRPAKIRTAE